MQRMASLIKYGKSHVNCYAESIMMLYLSDGKTLVPTPWRAGESVSGQAVWLDLYQPTREAELEAERLLGVDIPTREEMHAIEISERLYREGEACIFTATLLVRTEGASESHAVTFIVTPQRLLTLRYSEPKAFRAFAEQARKLPVAEHNGPSLFLGLLDAITNRQADVLEEIGREMDALTHVIFRRATPQGQTTLDHQAMLLRIGQAGDAVSKLRESLMTIGRVVAFAKQCDTISAGENHDRLKAQASDVAGLNDQASYLGGKVTFLLDAVLGFITIEQNDIIKIFSVAAAMFLPPTLIASIYGMNFRHIPELEWYYGYPIALGVMLLSALLPYLWFRKKKWI